MSWARHALGGFLALWSMAAGCAVSPSLRARQLSEREQAIAARADAHTAGARALLATTVQVNSGTLNPDGVAQVGQIFRRELDALGFQTEWVDQRARTGRAGHLIARHPGRQGRRVLLIGHLDTVFEPGSGFEGFRVEGDEAFGPGVADMKGGNVVIVYALRALHDVGVLSTARVTVILTGDEEDLGEPYEFSRGPLRALAREADIALGFEPMIRSRGEHWASVARRGSVGWTLQVEGTSGHSSRIFSDANGAGAIFEVARILRAFERVGGDVSINPGLMAGGVSVRYDGTRATMIAHGKTNVIPSRVVVRGGLRAGSDRELTRTRARMLRVVARNLPGTSAVLTFESGYPAMEARFESRRLLHGYATISEALGAGRVRTLDPSRRGAADISFTAPYVDGALAGLGIVGTGAHTRDERADLATLPLSIKRAAILIYRLSRSGG